MCVCVCVLCVYSVTEVTSAKRVVMLVRYTRIDLSDVRYGGDQGRADVRTPLNTCVQLMLTYKGVHMGALYLA